MFSFSDTGKITKMNRVMLTRLAISQNDVIGKQLEDLLTVGSKIFFQTHFYPLIKMQQFAREIYLSFKSVEGDIPVLLNVVVEKIDEKIENHCGGMEISNRSRFEKELLEAKKVAVEALSKNEQLTSFQKELNEQKLMLEMQNRRLTTLNDQAKELFKVIAHDLQEPLRKSVMFSSRLMASDTPENLHQNLKKIVNFNLQVRQMLLTLNRYDELEIAEIEYRKIDLREVIDSAIRDMDIDLENQNIVVSVDVNCEPFLADARLILGMFVELFRNSAKYRHKTDQPLNIKITATTVSKNIFFESTENYRYEDFIKINFVDDGVGLADDDGKIFKIIQRSDQLDQIGIGLAFCRKIIEKHQGSIIAKSVRNKALGFTIFLPVSPTLVK